MEERTFYEMPGEELWVRNEVIKNPELVRQVKHVLVRKRVYKLELQGTEKCFTHHLTREILKNRKQL